MNGSAAAYVTPKLGGGRAFGGVNLSVAVPRPNPKPEMHSYLSESKLQKTGHQLLPCTA